MSRARQAESRGFVRSPSARGRRVQAEQEPPLSAAARHADRELARIHSDLQFLLQVTPVNSLEAWEAFRAGGCEGIPTFRYRPLRSEATSWQRALAAIPLDEVEDPTVARLLREKREELGVRIGMLRDRGGQAFLEGSLRLYGPVERELLALARSILTRLPIQDEPIGAREENQVTEEQLARAARAELRAYRRAWPALPAEPEIRDDIPPGLVVSGGRLLIGRGTTAAEKRVEALLQHEVGTHMVTYYNGQAQPLDVLRIGLGGYEDLQEGLAVLSEYLVGGLTIARLRVLAARVLAAAGLVQGASFVDVFRFLHREHGFEPYPSYSIAMRVFRGGGLVKDVIYLRGVMRLAQHLADGGALEPLFRGKFALEHLPALRALERRGILRSPPLRPRILDHPRLEVQLERLRGGVALVEILERRLRKEDRLRSEARPSEEVRPPGGGPP